MKCPIKIRRRIWKNIAATQAFQEAWHALNLVRHFSSENMRHPYLSCLWTSVCVSYGRPFTHNNNVGPIDESLLPSGWLEFHKLLMAMRNKLCGHVDHQTTTDDGKFIIQAAIVSSNGELIGSARFGYPSPEYIKDMQSGIKALIEIYDQEWRRVFLSQFSTGTVPPGRNQINLSESDELFVNP